MSDHDLPPSEARAVIHRHIHDLRNMISCMDLQIHCLVEDPNAGSCGPLLQKIREQLAITEQGLRSLLMRFTEPSLCIAAAADLFHNWRQQIEKLERSLRIEWVEPACDAAITVDFSAVAVVLYEICREAKSPEGAPPLVAGITDSNGVVEFFIRKKASQKAHNETPPETQQWEEWQRLITISEGTMERTYDPLSAHSVTTLRFPSTE